MGIDIKKNQSMIVASLAVICTQAGMMMYAPSIPFLSKILKTGYTEIAYTLTAYVLGYAVAMLFFGGISDQLGRKKSYIATTTIFAGTSLLLAVTQSIDIFIALRFLQGIGGGGCAVIGRASVRDVYEGRRLVSAMSLISITFNVSMGAFQYLGGMIQTYASYQYDFMLMFFMGLIVLTLVIFKFDETHYQSKNEIVFGELIKNYWHVIREKRLMVMASGAGMGYSILLVFNVLGVYYLQSRLQVSPQTIGMIGIYFSVAYLVGGVCVNGLIKIFEMDDLIKLGKTMILIAGVVLFVTAMAGKGSLITIVSLLSFGLVGQAILYPCVMTKALEPHRHSPGSASSVFGFTQQFTGFCAVLIAGLLPYQSPYSLAIMILLIGLGGFYLLGDKSNVNASSQAIPPRE